MIILSLLEKDPAALRSAILAAPQKADALEVRLDALSSPTSAMLSKLFEGSPRPIIAACRRRADGGRFAGSEQSRVEALQAAVRAGASYIDVEHSTAAETLVGLADHHPAIGIILSHHDTRGMPERPRDLYRRMARRGKLKAVKIVGTARSLSDVIRVRDLLGGVSQNDPPLISFCMGGPGVLSRILALTWGSWATYASPGNGRETAPGQVSLVDLVGVYRVEEIDTETRFAGIVGMPVGHSLSPVMHNAAYREHGLNFRYVPLEVPKARDLADLRRLARKLRIRGLSITAPYKTRIMRHLDLVEPVAALIGAANTVVCDGRRLVGFNTDATGGFAALAEALKEQGESAEGTRVAVVGSGGAARALAHALSGAGATVLIASRSERPGRALARAVRGRYVAPGRLARESYDVLINCTPVGMPGVGTGGRRSMPVPASAVKGRLVYDLIYSPQTTPLLRAARLRHIPTLGGLEMLVRQAAEQYVLFTGRTAPVDTMREAARQALRGLPVDE